MPSTPRAIRFTEQRQSSFFSLQFTLPDHGYSSSTSRGVPVYAPAFAGTHCAYPRRDGHAGRV